MPLIIAVVVYGGTFFGYAGVSTAADQIHAGNQTQQHFVALKRAAIDQVAKETLHR